MRKKIGAAVLAAAALAVTFTGTAQAEYNPKCKTGVTQIGSTTYLKKGTETVASLKQFKGCNKNWAYVYVWDSWMAKHRETFHIRVAIWNRDGHEALDYAGADGRTQEAWSNGAETLRYCTYAAGNVFAHGYSVSGSTDVRC